MEQCTIEKRVKKQRGEGRLNIKNLRKKERYVQGKTRDVCKKLGVENDVM
jgi:hypothetical protein